MLHRFKVLLKRFERDERGAFIVLFAVLAIVLIATSGAVVDFTQIEQARTRAQIALDAAALGLQPRVFDTPARAEDYFTTAAQNLLEEQLNNDPRIVPEVTGATINVRNGQLILNAKLKVSTSFVSLVGVPNVTANLVAEATRQRLNLEVAMVLDNSGSMYYYSRMSNLITAAKLATDILFDYQATQPNVFISVVPFTSFVNVGTANRTASWMSQTGASSVSLQNFDDDDDETTAFTGIPAGSGRVNRWTLYDEFNNRPWTGCVDARVPPYDTTDDVPNNAVPDTMFQPVFAPDGPDKGIRWNSTPLPSYLSEAGGTCTRVAPVWVKTETKTNCPSKVQSGSSTTYTDGTYYNSCNKTVTPTYSGKDVNGATIATASVPQTQPADNSTYSYKNTAWCVTTYTGSGSSSNNYTNRKITTCTYDFSQREKLERYCKYKGRTFSGDGARADCPTTALLPLSNQRDTVKGRINDMKAEGATNIEQGAVWGFHAVSPTEPLLAKSYDEATSKIIIIMTDGENNVSFDDYSASTDPYNTFGVYDYMAWGLRSNKRLLTEATTPKDSLSTEAQTIAEVNRRTVAACSNAKANNIKIYTIGLSAPNQSTIDMLNACASPNEVINGQTVDYSQFTSDSAQLTPIFKKIAEQLSQLRLAQ